MIQMQTTLEVADNTGAKKIMAIRTLGQRKKFAEIGDIIRASVREAAPRGSVKKGEVVPTRYEMSKHMARTIVGAALQVWGKCVPVPAGRVSYGMRQVRIESHRGKPEELPLAHKYVELHKAGKASEIPAKGMQNTTLVAGAYRMVELEHGPDHFMMPVSSVSIGTTLAFAGFPGEPFTWMGTETKAKSPFLMTVPACTTNGSRGYFPVESAYAEGGYEAATSRFAPGSAERLVAGQLEQLKSLYGGASK